MPAPTSPSVSSGPDVHALLESLFGEDLHSKRVLSLSNGVLGVLKGAALGVRAIGAGLALAKGLDPTHATKQVDRLLSNDGLDLKVILPLWVGQLLGTRCQADVLLDWTEFEGDKHSTLMLSLRTELGRSMPLMWRTVQKDTLKGTKTDVEDDLLAAFAKAVPDSCKVTILADRGFDDHVFLDFLSSLGFAFIIRMRKSTLVESASGEVKPGKDWLHRRGWATTIRNAKITRQKHAVGAVVTVQDKDMDQPWILACSSPDILARDAIARYGRRFTCEELFRDIKDIRYGLGMSWSPIKKADRRDRMWLLATLAIFFLSTLGQAGEDIGISKSFETGKNNRRLRSVFGQGLFWFLQIPTMPEKRLRPLMEAFEARLRAFPVFGVLLAQTGAQE